MQEQIMENLTEEISRFPQRLKLAIGKGSARAFALQCGLSPTVMHQYLTGKSEPTRLALIAMASTAGVNLEWLMSGEGQVKKNKGSCLIDRDLYEGIIESVEESLVKMNKTLPLGKRLEACRYLYDLFKDAPGVNKQQAEMIIQLQL
jgi:transcriptional regulator with XRE-family HTH domain